MYLPQRCRIIYNLPDVFLVNRLNKFPDATPAAVEEVSVLVVVVKAPPPWASNNMIIL